MNIEGKVCCVTGGASGIGRELCRRFASLGAKGVAVCDVDGDGVETVAGEVGGLPIVVNVADEAAVTRMVEQTESEFGPIDLMFSNAGIGTSGGVSATNDQWQNIWDINVMSHIYAARAVLPAMIERGDGYIASTASAAGLLSQIGSAPYAVTKHAAVALAEWIAITHGDKGIKVSVLCPQAVRTAMTAGGAGVAEVDGMLEPEAVADAVVDALANEEFLILPHPEVREYMRRKTGDYDRWIKGMRRLQDHTYPGGLEIL